jgi:glutathione S-transferase
MLTIYGAPHSRAFRVVWLANELSISYRLVPVSFGVPGAECKKPWYLQLNPKGKVPTIDDDGFVLWDSAAINLYLAEKHNSGLYPASLRGRGLLLQWTFFVANELEPAVMAMLRNRIVLPVEQRSPALAEQAEETLGHLFDILESELQRASFFAGDEWGLADFMIACVLYIVYIRLEMDMTAWPRLASWTRASVERPAAFAARKLREPL